MEKHERIYIKEDNEMTILSLIFYGFLSTVALTVCVRTGKLIIRFVNGWFDRIEETIG